MLPKLEFALEDLVRQGGLGFEEAAADLVRPIVVHLDHVERKSWLRKIVLTSLFGLAIAAAVLFGVWYFFRRAKTRTKSYKGVDRFGFIDEVSQNISPSTDISMASLDELEAALLEAENQLADLEDSH